MFFFLNEFLLNFMWKWDIFNISMNYLTHICLLLIYIKVPIMIFYVYLSIKFHNHEPYLTAKFSSNIFLFLQQIFQDGNIKYLYFELYSILQQKRCESFSFLNNFTIDLMGLFCVTATLNREWKIITHSHFEKG